MLAREVLIVGEALNIVVRVGWGIDGQELSRVLFRAHYDALLWVVKGGILTSQCRKAIVL